jgi:hypothetical protein
VRSQSDKRSKRKRNETALKIILVNKTGSFVLQPKNFSTTKNELICESFFVEKKVDSLFKDMIFSCFEIQGFYSPQPSQAWFLTFHRHAFNTQHFGITSSSGDSTLNY